jgi:hypothetical protein
MMLYPFRVYVYLIFKQRIAYITHVFGVYHENVPLCLVAIMRRNLPR